MKKSILFLSLVLCSLSPSLAQKFVLPPLPQYDQVKPDDYNGKSLQKEFFFNGKKVLEIGYNSGSMFYGPFYHSGGGQDDSVYTYYKNDSYDIYTFGKGKITLEQFAENSTHYKYHQFDWQQKTIEKGEYYIMRNLYNEFNAHNSKYRIGQWILQPGEEQPYHQIDFDRLTVDGKKLTFTGNQAIIGTMIKKAQDKLNATYGKKFTRQYIHLNLDQSAYIPYTDARPEHPSGWPLLYHKDKNIEYVELTYDIVLEDYHFNVIKFRIDKAGTFMGLTRFSSFARENHYMTQGLDSKNNGRFHTSIINWKDVAKQNDFDISSKEFNVRMEWVVSETNDKDGDLYLVLEQSENTVSTKRSFTRYLKQLYINPWTGESKAKKDETGVAGVMEVETN